MSRCITDDPVLSGSVAARLPGRDLLILCFGLIALAMTLHQRLTMDQVNVWDAAYYYRMAESPGIGGAAPFAYRWLPHELAGSFHVPAKRAYELITWVCLLIGSALLARLLRHLGLPLTHIALLVVVAFLWAKWGGRFYVWYRAATEPFAYCIIIAGMLAAHKKQLLLLCLLATIGAACREECLLLVPYYALLNRRPLSLLALLPGVIVFAAIRLVTPVENEYSMQSVVLENAARKFGSYTELQRLLACTLTHAGLVSSILIIRWRTAWTVLRESPHLLFWIAMNLLLGVIGGCDTDRLMYYALPAELVLLTVVLADAPLPGASLLILVVGQVAISETFSSGPIRAANVFAGWNLAMWVIWTSAAAAAIPFSRSARPEGYASRTVERQKAGVPELMAIPTQQLNG